jgi:hypothetical protein
VRREVRALDVQRREHHEPAAPMHASAVRHPNAVPSPKLTIGASA